MGFCILLAVNHPGKFRKIYNIAHLSKAMEEEEFNEEKKKLSEEDLEELDENIKDLETEK